MYVIASWQIPTV